MQTEKTLNELILNIKNCISENYPELVEYLDEMPITLPDQKHPDLNVITLTSYYNSLVNLVENYEENHKENVICERFEKLPITEYLTLEKDTLYPESFIEINAVKISYNDVGEGRLPILFLHGFPFDKSMWKNQLDFLKTSNRVIAIDTRGFGNSKDENTPLSMELFSEDLRLFMDKLNIERAVLCGLSMGGFIALDAIKKFPERFDGLILCDTQCIADTAEVKEKRHKTIAEIYRDGSGAFKEKFVTSVFHSETLTNKTGLVDSLRTVVNANSDQILISGLIALADRSETCSVLKNIKVSTLIICGREDTVTPLAQSEAMQKQIKDATLRIVDNAGHVSNLEHPVEFNNYIKDFITILDASKKVEPNSEPLSPKI
jgi:pimeloyl-ACP methyl ester carboxylesterase